MSRYPLGGKSRLHFTRLLHSRLASTMAGPYYTASLWGRATGAITKCVRGRGEGGGSGVWTQGRRTS